MRKNKKQIIISAVLLVLLVAVPLVQKYVLGMELRPVPGAQSQAQPIQESLTGQPDAAELGMTLDYGYYPDDHWVEEKCGFYIAVLETGSLVLNIYYPFEITGDQVGHVYVDGQFCLDFTVTGDRFDVEVPVEAGQRFIQINSDFAQAPGETDKRALAFVLDGVTGSWQEAPME